MKEAKMYEVIRQIRPLMKLLVEAVELELGEVGITVAMRAVLEDLSLHGGSTVPRLAHNLMVKRQSVHPIIDDLLTIGAVEKKQNPIHKKSSILSITPKGLELIEIVRRKENENLQQISDDFTSEELETTNKTLIKLKESFLHFKEWRTT